MCDGHAVVCMRDPEIFVRGGGGGGEFASTEEGRYFLYIVSRGKVRTSIPMETYSTCKAVVGGTAGPAMAGPLFCPKWFKPSHVFGPNMFLHVFF